MSNIDARIRKIRKLYADEKKLRDGFIHDLCVVLAFFLTILIVL